MAHSSTVLAQMLKLLPRHEFDAVSQQHHTAQYLRAMPRLAQFSPTASAQLTGRSSLRALLSKLSAQSSKLYLLCMGLVSRSSLARVNENQPWTLYAALFFKLLNRCQQQAPGHRFRFINKLFSLDSSTIDVCLSMFPWARFRQAKGAIKLHVGLNHAGMLPAFVSVTDGKSSDVAVGRALSLPTGSIVVFDRGYTDYTWYNQLNDQGIFFVTRLKRNACHRVLERRKVKSEQGLTCDQTIRLTSAKGKNCPIALRRVGYRDPETGRKYVFLTNNFKLAAATIAAIYKSRWQIELFFKWIKQNLKIKTFLGTSRNAVLTQIWVAMCVYLLLAYLKFMSRSRRSMQQILRLLQLNLFERRPMMELFNSGPPKPKPPSPQQALVLF